MRERETGVRVTYTMDARKETEQENVIFFGICSDYRTQFFAQLDICMYPVYKPGMVCHL